MTSNDTPTVDLSSARWVAEVELDRIPRAGWSDVFEVIDRATGERLHARLKSVGLGASALVWREPTTD